jgi:hypothetical protein
VLHFSGDKNVKKWNKKDTVVKKNERILVTLAKDFA